MNKKNMRTHEEDAISSANISKSESEAESNDLILEPTSQLESIAASEKNVQVSQLEEKESHTKLSNENKESTEMIDWSKPPSEEEIRKEEFRINRNYEIALRNLNENAWSIMLPSEKLNDLQAIENKLALDQGRIPAEVRAEHMEEYGYQLENTITVNKDILLSTNTKENAQTVLHEASHVRDWQATFLSEVRSQYDPKVLAERNTPIPSSEEGYWNHPAEIAARQAEIDGFEKIMQDKETIAEFDRENPASNQILTTYDYVVLENSNDQTTVMNISEEENTEETLTNASETSITEDEELIETNNEENLEEESIEQENGEDEGISL